MADGDKKKKLTHEQIAKQRVRSTGGGMLTSEAESPAMKLIKKTIKRHAGIIKKSFSKENIKKGYKLKKKKIDITKPTSKF